MTHGHSDAVTTRPPLPLAYGVTVASPFEEVYMPTAAREAPAIANAAEKRKKSDMARKVAVIPDEELQGRSQQGCNFVTLAFAMFGSPSVITSNGVERCALDKSGDSHASKAWLCNLVYVCGVCNFLCPATCSNELPD